MIERRQHSEIKRCHRPVSRILYPGKPGSLSFIWSRRIGICAAYPFCSRFRDYASSIVACWQTKCTWHFNPQGLSPRTVACPDRALLPHVFNFTRRSFSEGGLPHPCIHFSHCRVQTPASGSYFL